MRAIIYDGAKESPCHKEMKTAIGDILSLDSDCRNIYVDELFKRRLPQERYKPDVQGYYHDKNLIFEIQISSDFITIIQAREEYYQNKQAYLLWVFNAFSTDFSRQTLAQKDIFYGSNRNAFCLTKECVRLSHKNRKLHLQAFYQIPTIVEGHIHIESAPPQIITIDDIQFCDEDFSAYFYDFKGNYEKCEQRLKNINEQQKLVTAKNEYRALLLELAEKMENLPYWELEQFILKKSGLSFEYSNASGLISYVVSAIKGKPKFVGSDNNKSLYRNTLNKKNKRVRRFFCFFHAIARNTPFYEEVAGDLLQKIQEALAELRQQKEKSDFYPDRRYESVLQVFFPKAHQHFLDLMQELGLE